MEELTGARKYADGRIYCNCCGRVINELGKQKEDYLHVEKGWSYFSSKDLSGHAFNICEACYDKLIASFKIPVEEFPVDDIPTYTEEEIKALNEAYAEELGK